MVVSYLSIDEILVLYQHIMTETGGKIRIQNLLIPYCHKVESR